MKIKRISWWNYRGLDDGEIIADGADVLVRGQNGVGKTSIASIVPFVLFDNERDKVKPFIDGEVTRDPNTYSGAEVEFDSGRIFRREIIWTGRSNTTELYINGAAVSKKAFDAEVELLTGKGGESVFNPFVFCLMKAEEQRKFLTKIFPANDNEPTHDFFYGQSADKVIASLKTSLKNLKGEAADIPKRIDENMRKLEDTPLDPKVIESIEAEKKSLRDEQDKLFATKSESEVELASAHEEKAKLSAQTDWARRVTELEEMKKNLSRCLAHEKSYFEELRAEHNQEIDAKPGICKSCNQKMPMEKFNEDRNKRIKAIGRKAFACRDKIIECEGSLKKILVDLDAAKKKAAEDSTRLEKISELNERLAALSAQVAEENSKRRERKNILDDKISEIDRELGELRFAAELPKRIEELRRQEKELNQRIVELEGQLRAAKDYRDRQIERLEKRIAEHFEHVKFKMFELVSSTGEYRPTCAAMLHGVPYTALSKGEQLKAALDIWRTLQKVYGVELPLMIDDAESYTRNSFVDVPNQLWLFKVSDEEKLVIEVKKEARSAA